VFLGDGNDSISVDRYYAPYYALLRTSTLIGTGDGNDTITSTGIIYNEGVIETGNGDDSIIVDIDTEALVSDMALRTTAVQLIWVMVTTPSLLMRF
jgi:hypothetical protein